MQQLITFAERIRGKYLYEIDDCRFSVKDFLQTKFKYNQYNIKRICSLLYKKQN